MERKIYTQRTNNEKAIEALADGYRTKIGHELWLADGLQKDAIQNSWDARIDKKHGKNWECGFSLMSTKEGQVICISDQGTSGLNGTKFFSDSELDKILLSGADKREDLANFLNSNWSDKSGEEGGNRGRGKTLFLVASKKRRVFFDSVRSSDNSYVFGEIYLDSDKQIKFRVHYDQEGKEEFKESVNRGITPLVSCGTRIFITNPDQSVIEAIKTGQMLSFVSSSRWETIKKYESKIFVDDGHGKKYASTPYWYEDSVKGVEGLEFKPEAIKESTLYKTKRLVLRYAPNLNLPESVRGIGIQRGGMTIERVRADELVNEKGMVDIYGWLEMEGKPLEEEMKILCEGPEHFDFSWTQKPAKYLRDYLRAKTREFAKELKIIESEQSKKNKIQKDAEAEALKLLTPLFKKLGLFGKHIGKKKREDHFRREKEPLRLSIPDIEFPRDNKRVNYGEKIDGTYVIPISDINEDINILVRVFVVSPEGKTELLQEKEINLRPGRGPEIGAGSILISKKYTPGGYSLRARMVSLEDKKDLVLSDGKKIEKGTILYDRINQKFYVEVDPPESGPFDFRGVERDDKNYLLEWVPEGDGHVIFYNELHPRIKPLLSDLEKLTEYLMEQAIFIAFQIKLEESIADDDDSDQEFSHLVKSKDVSGVWQLFLRRYSEFIWDLKKQK